MCGFAGHVDLDGLDRGALEPRLERALRRLQPRGPDARGSWIDQHCALANARLAVLDLSEDAAQPMARHGLVIAYNGEIYNFAELRTELAALGQPCETRSDTEVLLAGWRQWGEALLPRLVGMFAFALWDPAAQELVLARDRYGKKPLLLRMDGSRITFASDLAALEAVADSHPPLDPAALRLLFTLRYVPEPYTIVAGVKKLPPGYMARFTARGLAVTRWFDAAAERPSPYADEKSAAQDLPP
jgi:asparagine synthase (glutamine-hydrolysing)